jgi:osmotically-inducible protein OsmY
VSERAGTVTLRGTVRSIHQRRSAAETVRKVRGVPDVGGITNRIEVVAGVAINRSA